MVQRFDEDFKREVVRVAQTSGHSQKRIAGDFGIGLSTLGKWLFKYGDQTGLSQAQLDQQKEIDRLRKENRILKEERDVLNLEGSENDPVNHFPRTRLRNFSQEQSDEICIYRQLSRRIKLGAFVSDFWREFSRPACLACAPAFPSQASRHDPFCAYPCAGETV